MVGAAVAVMMVVVVPAVRVMAPVVEVVVAPVVVDPVVGGVPPPVFQVVVAPLVVRDPPVMQMVVAAGVVPRVVQVPADQAALVDVAAVDVMLDVSVGQMPPPAPRFAVHAVLEGPVVADVFLGGVMPVNLVATMDPAVGYVPVTLGVMRPVGADRSRFGVMCPAVPGGVMRPVVDHVPACRVTGYPVRGGPVPDGAVADPVGEHEMPVP